MKRISINENKDIVVVYPIKEHFVIELLLGKYKNRVVKVEDLKLEKEKVQETKVSHTKNEPLRMIIRTLFRNRNIMHM